ncbi:MAG: hypothetical protein WBO06_05125 [Gammaproteobacteria bacterium]
MACPRHRDYSTPLLAVLLLAASILPVHAFDAADLTLGNLEGEGWSARDLAVQFEWLDASHVRVQLEAAAASLPEPLGKITAVSVECARATLAPTQLRCPAGLLKLRSPGYGRQAIRITFTYRFSDGRLDAHLRNVRLWGGVLALDATLHRQAWQLEISADAVPVPTFTAGLAAAGYALPVLEGEGHFGLQARINGTAADIRQVSVDARVQAKTLSDASGNLATEGLDLQFTGKAIPVRTGWDLTLEVTGRQGQVYAAPVYIEIPAVPVHARARLDWQVRANRLLVNEFAYRHPGSIDLQASGRLALGPASRIETLSVFVNEGVLPALYKTYLQPWVATTQLGSLETSGKLYGQLDWREEGIHSMGLSLVDVVLEDREERFGLRGLRGQLGWAAEETPVQSRLQWDSGSVYRVALGAARVALESGRDYVRLEEPARLPVLDGMLQIDQFDLDFAADKPLRWEVDGLLTPISMTELTRALGWPEFSGKLSGIIPNVRYDGGDLEVGGVLLVRVFDGEVTLRDLRLEQPFGVIPRLWVNAKARDIDLKTLTRTFSFGRIEGRLQGHVNDLYMESWRPVAFDAEFSTPADDKSRHRISQKAVDNIASIGGGGVGGALSRGFLRFLEDFPYDRLGIRCRLENGTCAMGGVAPAPEGYYLVKGRFIPPRLDVIGFADRVNWNSLIAQIVAVTGQQSVVVQ